MHPSRQKVKIEGPPRQSQVFQKTFCIASVGLPLMMLFLSAVKMQGRIAFLR